MEFNQLVLVVLSGHLERDPHSLSSLQPPLPKHSRHKFNNSSAAWHTQPLISKRISSGALLDKTDLIRLAKHSVPERIMLQENVNLLPAAYKHN